MDKDLARIVAEQKCSERRPKEIRIYTLGRNSRVCLGEAWIDQRNLMYFDISAVDEAAGVILGYRRVPGEAKFSGEPAIATVAEFLEYFRL